MAISDRLSSAGSQYSAPSKSFLKKSNMRKKATLDQGRKRIPSAMSRGSSNYNTSEVGKGFRGLRDVNKDL